MLTAARAAAVRAGVSRGDAAGTARGRAPATLARTMEHDDNERVFRELVERAFCRGDTTVFDELVSADLLDHEAGSPARSAGRDSMRWVAGLLRTAFPDLRVTVEDIVTVGDRTWARVRYRGTNSGQFMDSAPTGRYAEWDGVSICRYAGGRLVEHWGVVDRLSGLQQLGLAGRPGAH
ncbi:MAG: ester cyclase [Chloroflexi bacterium]|nr:MAG: ester cyclase [Chloroflexota bacterium]